MNWTANSRELTGKPSSRSGFALVKGEQKSERFKKENSLESAATHE
jgi:hypothetical protein